MTTITLELPDEVRAMIDEARGDQDVATFLVAAGELVAKRKLSYDYPAPLADDLTAADHIRMAEEAEDDAVDLDEFTRILYEQLDRQDRAWAVEDKR